MAVAGTFMFHKHILFTFIYFSAAKKGSAAPTPPQSNPMSRAELERHLESKREMFGIEKAPALLPMEIFSNDNSNLDR